MLGLGSPVLSDDGVGLEVIRRLRRRLAGREEVELDGNDRVCLLIDSHEMSRARGGPHCLTHPLERDDV